MLVMLMAVRESESLFFVFGPGSIVYHGYGRGLGLKLNVRVFKTLVIVYGGFFSLQCL